MVKYNDPVPRNVCIEQSRLKSTAGEKGSKTQLWCLISGSESNQPEQCAFANKLIAAKWRKQQYANQISYDR